MPKQLRYAEGFRRDTVRIAIESDNPTYQVSEGISISVTTLGNCVAKEHDRAQKTKHKSATRNKVITYPADRQVNANLKLENEFLSKSRAFFSL